MATIKQQGDGKYSVRIGNQKFNGLSQQEAQRRADINYQVAPDSQTDSVKQKARNAALGVNPGDSNAIRDSAINSGTLVAKDINLPSAPTTPKFTYDSILNTAVGSDPSVETTETTGSNVDQGSYDLLQSYLSGQKQQPNLMDIQNKLEKDNKLKQKREAKNNYQTQLNTIVAKSQADQLAVTGQGRGIPEVIIGGQQSQIAKEAAIQALPIQALLSAASDDLATAEAHVDKLFQIYAQDAENSVKFYNDQARTVYDFLSKKEQDKVDAIKDQKKFEQGILASKIDAQQSYALQALRDGNTVLFNRLSSIQPPTDVNSASYQEDLESYNTKVVQAMTKYATRPVISPSPEVPDSRFTTTQVNSGAANAGVPIETFGTYDQDTQNYFINTSSTELQKKIQSTIIDPLTSGKKSHELKSQIYDSTLPASLKRYLYTKVDEQAQVVKPKKWFNKVVDYFKS